MLQILHHPAYYKDGAFLPAPAEGMPTPAEAKKGTMAYGILTAHNTSGDDENLKKALDIIIRESKASTSYLQRRMGIGYNKAAEIIDKLEQRGIVSAPLPGGQKRDILVFDELGKPD